MAQQESGASGLPDLMLLKCANCYQYLQNPIQLPACYHIICHHCLSAIDDGSHQNLNCPKCGQENARPNVLRRISGIDNIFRDIQDCDKCGVESAKWNCFKCGLNLCSTCRGHHAKDHEVLLLPQFIGARNLSEDREDGAAMRGMLLDKLETDGVCTSSSSGIQCPICTGASCEHFCKLMALRDEPQFDIIECKVPGHTDCNGEAKLLEYLCLKCWILVCGKCSQEGDHKLHETKSLSLIKHYLNTAETKQSESVDILRTTCSQDIEEEKGIEERLRSHTQTVQAEMNKRRNKILEEVSYAFERAVLDAVSQGKDILGEYREQQSSFIRHKNFLEQVSEALENIKIGEQYDIFQYVNAYEKLHVAAELITDLQRAVASLSKPAERRLVLPQVKNLTVTPPPLARVGTEWKKLKLVTHFKPEDISLFHSIVVTGNGKCLLSCQRYTTESYDTILQCDIDGNCAEYDIEQGRYFISRLSSGELVASVKLGSFRNKQYVVQYSDGGDIERQDGNKILKFRTIKDVDFEPLGIATTKDNLILLCTKPEIKGKDSPSYLLLMTLQGKVLKAEANPNMGGPDYVAISDSGDICVTDIEESSVVILDRELNIKERMVFRHATSLVDLGAITDSDLKFRPCGVCYDHYGRIIVADPDNQCVVRLIRDIETQEYKMEPLLTKSDDLPWEFSSPKLVAMGEDSHLWVVCSEYIFVFEYCT